MKRAAIFLFLFLFPLLSPFEVVILVSIKLREVLFLPLFFLHLFSG